MMGANIGTTIKAILAAQRMDVFAKRTGVVHLLFNIMGVVIFMPFLWQFSSFIHSLGGDTGRMIANAHLVFNIATAFLFLLVADRIASLVSGIVKSEKSEIIFKGKFLNGKLPENNRRAMELVLREMEHEMERIEELFRLSIGMVKSGRMGDFQRVAKLEALTDFLDDQISDALAQISSRNLSKYEAADASYLVRISNDMEQLGDMGEAISIVARKMDEKGLTLLPESHAELSAVDSVLFRNLELMKRCMMRPDPSETEEMRRNNLRINKLISRSYLSHIKRLMEKKKGEKFAGAYFADVMAGLEAANAKADRIMARRMRLSLRKAV